MQAHSAQPVQTAGGLFVPAADAAAHGIDPALLAAPRPPVSMLKPITPTSSQLQTAAEAGALAGVTQARAQ